MEQNHKEQRLHLKMELLLVQKQGNQLIQLLLLIQMERELLKKL